MNRNSTDGHDAILTQEKNFGTIPGSSSTQVKKENTQLPKIFDNIIADLPGHVYWKDKNGVYLGCNKRQAQSLGFQSSAEVIGKTDFDFPCKEHAILYRQNDLKVMETGQTETLEETAEMDGRKAIVLSQKSPLRDESGEVIGIIGISLDITDRKMNEENSRREKENAEFALAYIIEHLPGHVYWKNKDLVYQGCNLAQAQSAGFLDVSEMIGKSDYEMPWCNEADLLRQSDLMVMNTKQELIREEILKIANSEDVSTFLSRKVPFLNCKGEVIGILSVSFDITDRKKMEESLVQAKKAAEAANEAKSDFISNMQHDLMTPFSGIHGAADLIYAFYVEKYPELREWLEPMMRSCEQWERIHYKMFDAIELIDPAQAIEKFYLDEEINRVAEMMSAFLHFKHLRLLIPGQEELRTLGMIKSNRLKIHLILLSLISNAIKFTDTGEIRVRVFCDERFFSIQVEDTGIGIPADKFEYIFEKFTKLSRSNLYAGNFQGIGAGLYIARHQAQSLGGEIKVSSDVGKGSIFTLLLPKGNQFEDTI